MTGRDLFDQLVRGLDEFVPGLTLMPAWSPDGKAVGILEGGPDDRKGWLVDLATGARSLLVDVVALREQVRAATGETPPGRGLPFAHFGFVAPRTIAAQVGAHQLTIDLDTLTVTKIPADSPIESMLGLSEKARRTPKQYLRTQPLVDPLPVPATISPDGRFHVSTQDGNLVLRSTSDGREVPLTQDGTPEHEWRFDMLNPMLAALGMAVPVTNWSVDSTVLAAYKVDNRGVARLPQVHYLKRDDEVVWRYHAKAGGVLKRYTLHLVDIYGKPPVDIDLGDTTDTYPVFAGWLSTAEVLIFRMSRDCRRVDILAADPRTGAVRELFAEQSETFVRVHHDIYFGRKLGLWLTPERDQILWHSDRDGWKHLYRYDLDGRLLGQITSGAWPVDEVKLVNDGYVYFTAHIDQRRPYDLHVCRVPVSGGDVVQLTEGDGVHSPMFAPTGEVFLDTVSSPAQPPVTTLRRVDGQLLGEVTRADATVLTELGWTPPQQFSVLAADGETELWGAMFFPMGFDPARRYPVVEYVYGGPQIAVGPHTFNSPFSIPATALAQLGYITVILDARGTPERSKAFHDVVYRNWAGHLADDHAEALKQLADRHSFLDVSAGVGVTGGSWGGYTTFRLLADRPDVYAAGVASSPGFDPYSSVLYECYLGLPADNKDAYDSAQTITLAPKLTSALLIACGTSDHATWTDAIKMSEALIRAGKEHEFVVLPEQYHGYDAVHSSYFWSKAIDFFGRHLPPAS